MTLGRGIPAIYEFHKVEIDTIPFKALTTEETKNELFHMRVPKYLVMFMVNNSAFHGDYTKNPFNFRHYNLKSLHLTRDMRVFPLRGLHLTLKMETVSRNSWLNIKAMTYWERMLFCLLTVMNSKPVSL